MNKEFYVVLIEAVEKEEAFVQVFYTYANHLGEAIENMLSYGIKIGLENPRIAEADIFQFENLPHEAIKSDKSEIYYLNERYYFPLNDYLKFQLPYGIIYSCEEGEFEPELINESYTIYTDENKIQHMYVVADRDRLLDTYLSIIEKINSIRVLWLRLDKEWENGNVIEFYANEKLNDYSTIKKFILNNMNDVFSNGYLSITVYSNDGSTNISIDEHKMIHISAMPKEFIEMISKYIEKIGFKYCKNNKFYSIDYGYYHYHYRPSNSKSRQELISFLKEEGFFLWRKE